MTTFHGQIEELLAAYSLDAVSEDETRVVERHLPTCESCTQKLAELRRTATDLAGLADDRPVPAGLRARVMSAVAREAAPARAPVVAWWPGRLAGALAASVAILVGVSAALGVGLIRANDRSERQERLLTRSYDALGIMARADERWTVGGTGAAPVAHGVLGYSSTDGSASLVLWDMDGAEAGSYNAWTVQEGRRVPAGRMWAEADGFWAVLPVESSLEGIGVTLVLKGDGTRTDVVDFTIPGDPVQGAGP